MQQHLIKYGTIFCALSYFLTARALPLERLQLPAGFHISLFSDDVPDARQMAVTPSGIIAVGSRKAGKVYILLPNKSMSGAKQRIDIASNLTLPNGVAWHDSDLYVATQKKLLRYPNLLNTLKKIPKPQIIYDNIPSTSHHGWHVIKFGPDGKLYISIGAPCNVCLSKDKRLATIARMDADGHHVEIVAHGVRNSVGFDWHPTTRELWFTDNGRDWMSDDVPPDEINKIKKIGQHYGFPYYFGNKIPDPHYGKTAPSLGFVPPELNLQAHVAPLGLLFYTGSLFPAPYKQLYVAMHGSWNRRHKVGYKVSMITESSSKVLKEKDFITGWLKEEKYWGRPVDIVQYIDGSLLISDDYAGVIYRATYKPIIKMKKKR